MTTEVKKIKEAVKSIKLSTLDMIWNSKSPHIGGCFSVVEVITTLYFSIMHINPHQPDLDNRDRFILSKGHAAAVLYATLAERGFFNKDLLSDFYKNGGKLPGHVSRGLLPGIETSTGSLGHGLSVGVGMALGARKLNKKFKTFVVLSDGECDEGSTWEAILFAGNYRLENLIAVVDYNKWQSFGKTKEIMNLEPFKAKWNDFGWSVKEVDGHNIEAINLSLSNLPFEKNKPSILIAHTIKGHNLPNLEDTLESHYRPPTEDEYRRAKEIIKNS